MPADWSKFKPEIPLCFHLAWLKAVREKHNITSSDLIRRGVSVDQDSFSTGKTNHHSDAISSEELKKLFSKTPKID